MELYINNIPWSQVIYTMWIYAGVQIAWKSFVEEKFG